MEESGDLEREDREDYEQEPLDINQQPEEQPVHPDVKDLEDEEEPTSVFIDIALGNQKHRITLLPDSDARAIAEDFAHKHGLDQKLMLKLKEQLENNIETNF